MKRLVMVRRCHAPPPPGLGECCGGVRYGECRRNHAARTGGYTVDGCREFLAAGEDGTGGALRCAACGCHRSFHRRLVRRCCCCSCRDDTDAAADAARWDAARWDCSPEVAASRATGS